jgi:hypothetical protein
MHPLQTETSPQIVVQATMCCFSSPWVQVLSSQPYHLLQGQKQCFDLYSSLCQRQAGTIK